MKIIHSPQELQQLVKDWRCAGETVGFVPTMGALHEGHLALARAARDGNTKFVASLFVNPTQFGPNEDFAKYPRPLERDEDLLREAGCDVLFVPQLNEMYNRSSEPDLVHPGQPQGGANNGGYSNGGLSHGIQTWVEVGKLGEIWEGVVRPGHLRGVSTVVSKLFNIVKPHRAYFGEKDYQQLKVIERLVKDLFFDLEIVAVPTVRDEDGLALSSRNAYLAPDERDAALAISKALRRGAELAGQGERDVTKLGVAMQQICETQPLIALQYIAVVDAETLAPLQQLTGAPARVLIAARVGHTRLIDNISIQ